MQLSDFLGCLTLVACLKFSFPTLLTFVERDTQNPKTPKPPNPKTLKRQHQSCQKRTVSFSQLSRIHPSIHDTFRFNHPINTIDTEKKEEKWAKSQGEGREKWRSSGRIRGRVRVEGRKFLRISNFSLLHHFLLSPPLFPFPPSSNSPEILQKSS